MKATSNMDCNLELFDAGFAVTVRWQERAEVWKPWQGVTVIVDPDGLISLPYVDIRSRPEFYDWLVEEELAEWQAIGTEDSELFATEKMKVWHAAAQKGAKQV